MRDLVAGVLAVALLVVAAPAWRTTLQMFRKRRRQRPRERADARPHDRRRNSRRRRPGALHRRRRAVSTTATARSTRTGSPPSRMLINGAVDRRLRVRQARAAHGRADDDRAVRRSPGRHRPRSLGRRDRGASTARSLVECGAIRERVSQELARAVFDAVKRRARGGRTPCRLSRCGRYHSVSAAPARWLTTRAMHEQQIGQAIDVAHQHADPTAGSSATMRRSARRQTAAPGAAPRRRGAAGQDETAQRRQLRLEPVDQLLRAASRRRRRATPW